MLAIFGFDFFYGGWLDACGGYFEFGYILVLADSFFFEHSAKPAVLPVDCADCVVCNCLAGGFIDCHTSDSNTC